MRMKMFSGICVSLMMLAASCAPVAQPKAGEGKAPLAAKTKAQTVQKGMTLETQYAEEMKALKAEIVMALPKVDEKKTAEYVKAYETEKVAEANRNAKQSALGKNRGHTGLLNHRKGWIGRAIKGVAEAKETLKKAQAMKAGDEKAKALKAANEGLAKIQDNYNMAASELKKSQKLVDDAKLVEPKLIKELDVAKDALAKAESNTAKALNALNLKAFLASDKLDAKLAKYVVMKEATPKGLADYAQQGRVQKKHISSLLADAALMKQMVVADGAKKAQYGPAMKIYTDIQKASKKSRKGVLQRVAVAVALEHAEPMKQRSATGKKNAPKVVDPVKRYLYYEKSYLAGELDAGFKGLSVWEYRMIVNGEEPDEISAWGRKMLHSYRPDHISTADYRWRYVAAVRTDIRYGSQYNKFDKPELQFFQNILMNGGVCGRRAFFGRFILRAFGVPTTARPSPGHAALAHWTPEGWVVCLGGGWGAGTTWTVYKKDLDFLAATQARMTGKPFVKVKRAQWVGDVMGETRNYGLLAGKAAFWNGISLYTQRAIIEEAKAATLAAVGTDIGEANESKVKEAVKVATVTDADRKIVVSRNGTITIPAVASSKPTNSTAKIKFIESNLGGMQIHYSRNGKPEEFEYTFDAPKAGTYSLTTRVVVPSQDQHLLVASNGAKKPVDIALPLTVGLWGKTASVEITLVKGKNVLTFSRGGENIRGMTIKDFTLKLKK